MTAFRCGWLIASLLLLAWPVRGAESVSVLLQKAIYAEETEGNLDAAIKIYEGITKEADANRSLVAQAFYRLGLCELKRGNKPEAEAAFRRILVQYADQTDLIVKVRQQIENLSGPTETPVVVRKIWTGAEDFEVGARVSSDGKHLTYVDLKSGNVKVRELHTTKTRSVTDHKGWPQSQALPMYPVNSDDGKLVAYIWASRKGNELRVASIEDSVIKPILEKNIDWCEPQDWLPGGREVAVILSETNRSVIALVNPFDGNVRELRQVPDHESWKVRENLRFSPDGRFLVCQGRPSRDTEESDLFLISVTDGVETSLIEHPAEDTVLGWTPDGRHVLFVSDRRMSKDIWAIQVEAGRAKNEAIFVKAGLGDVTPLGIGRDGALYYGVWSGGESLYRASFDFDKEKIAVRPSEIPRRRAGGVLRASLSPNGRFLAYHARQGRSNARPELMLMDLETNRQRRLHAATTDVRVDDPIWSSDNRTLFQRTQTSGDQDREVEFSLIETQAGSRTVLAKAKLGSTTAWSAALDEREVLYVWFSPAKNAFVAVRRELASGQERETIVIQNPELDASRFFAISPDLKSIYYANNPKKPSATRPAVAFRHDLATGQKQELSRWTNSIEIFPSPDRRHLAIANLVGVNERLIKLFSVQSPEPREVWSYNVSAISTYPQGRPLFATWTSDGQRLVFRKEFLDMSGEKLGLRSEFWSLAAVDGTARKIELVAPWISSGTLMIHPDGRQFFFQGTDAGVNDVWVMENFLPSKWSGN